MTPKGILKKVLKAVAVPPLRVAVDMVGWARTPDGVRFDVPKGFHPYDYFHLWTGNYEKAEMEILDSHFETDNTIIEIGANIGVVSRAALKDKLSDNGKLICVEANPQAIPFLEKNISDVVKGHQVEILPVAVGAPTHEGETHAFAQKRSLGSSLLETSKARNNFETIDVPVRSLSSIVNEHAQNGYSLICDAEGAEILILEHDAHSLDKCRQIAIELHHPSQTGINVTPDEMVEKFKGLGFKHGPVVHNTHYFSRGLGL